MVQVVDNCLQLDLAKFLSFVTATASEWDLLRRGQCAWPRGRHRPLTPTRPPCLLLVIEVIGVDDDGLDVDRGQVHVLRLHRQALRPTLVLLRRIATAPHQLVVVVGADELAGTLRRGHSGRVLGLAR